MPPVDPNTYFLQQGILGVIIFVLGSVIVWMQHRYDTMIKEKDAEIKALNAAIVVLLEKRVAEYAEVITDFSKFSVEMTTAQEALQKTSDGIASVLQSHK